MPAIKIAKLGIVDPIAPPGTLGRLQPRHCSDQVLLNLADSQRRSHVPGNVPAELLANMGSLAKQDEISEMCALFVYVCVIYYIIDIDTLLIFVTYSHTL
jgi:hypothetical protein